MFFRQIIFVMHCFLESKDYYRYKETEEGVPELENIEDDEEYEIVADAFDELLDEAEYDEIVDEEELED